MTLNKQELRMRAKSWTLLSIAAVLFVSGCTTTQPPTIVQPQVVKVPVPCAIDLPTKPKDNGTLDSAKRIAGYYKQIEWLLIDCQKIKEIE